MRVLVIGSVFPRHATDDQVPWLRQSCRHLRAAGAQLEVLAPSFRGLKSHTIDGMTVHRFRYGPAAWETLTHEEGAPSKLRRRPWLKLLAVAYLWQGFWTLIKLLRQNKYDLVEVHWPFPHAYMALPAIWAGVPAIYHYHSAELKLAARSTLGRLLLAWSLPWARAHIANSSYTAQLIEKIRPGTAVQIIPYGSTLHLDTRPAAATGPRTQLIFVGRHIQRKGLPTLITAMQQLPAAFTLTVVGQGDETSHWQQLAAGDPRIRFVGSLSADALAATYTSHHLFILPAIVDGQGDTEGLGVVLIEAIAAGLPVIASRVGGIPDVIIDNHTGLLVEPNDPTALAAAILRISQDEKLAQTLVDNAQAHVRAHFSWEQVTQATLQLYRSVLAKTSIV